MRARLTIPPFGAAVALVAALAVPTIAAAAPAAPSRTAAVPAAGQARIAQVGCVRRRNVVFAITTEFVNPTRPTGNGCWPWIRTGLQSGLARCELQRPSGPIWAYDDTDFLHGDDVARLNACRAGRGAGFEYMAYTPGRGWRKIVAPNVARYYAEMYRRNLGVPYEPAAYNAWRANPRFAIPLLNVGMSVASDAAVAAAVRKLCVESAAGVGLWAGSGSGGVSIQRRGVILRALNSCTMQA